MRGREIKALIVGGLVFIAIMIPLAAYGFVVVGGALIKILIEAFQ